MRNPYNIAVYQAHPKRIVTGVCPDVQKVYFTSLGHLLLGKPPVGQVLDHIDCDTTNHRRSNMSLISGNV